MSKFKQGMYVRVPVSIESEDLLYPRLFVLGMVREIDEIAATVKVKFYDLFESEFIYGWAKAKDTYPIQLIQRAYSPVGFPVQIKTEKKIFNGRILMTRPGTEKDDFCFYVVELEGGEIRRFPENNIMLDFTGVDYSPYKAMANYEFQNPSWFGSRYTVSSTMHVLNNAVYGFRALAGCRTFMMAHQVTTVLRCLQSNVIRYMLADEVGMGKTIEACSIVKIQKQRNPNYHTLYIVPDQLVGQWRFELSRKFAINAELITSKLSERGTDFVIPLTELGNLLQILDSIHFDMIVVDETHKILRSYELYRIIQHLSSTHSNILLLSATPVTSRKEEYKRLLSLLDPDRYAKMEPDEFDALVDKQHDLGDKLYDLYTWLDDFSENRESILEQLKEIQELLEDKELSQMILAVNSQADDQGLEAVQRILAYITEEYRMEKNIIRNRRGILNLAPRLCEAISYEMAGDQESYYETAVIDLLFESLQSQQTELSDDIIQNLLGAAFSTPWALLSALDQNTAFTPSQALIDQLDKWKNAAEAEIESLDQVLDDPDQIHGRLIRAYDYLEQETDLLDSQKPFKAVVFTNYPETMTRFVKICQHRLGKDHVACLATGMNHQLLEKEATRFQSDPNCRLIICDPIGTEGRNLQSADMILHLDTPWDIGQIEQRIGRLDRIGRSSEKAVLSIVIYAENSLEEQLFTLWHEGMNVYTQSLCGLEIILDTIMEMVMKALRQDIHYGLRESMDDIRLMKDDLDMELTREQFFDMASVLYHPLQLMIQNMLEIYQNKEDTIFAEAMMAWANQAGFLGYTEEDEINEIKDSIVEFSGDRFSPKATTNAFLIPPKWNFYHVKENAITGTFNRATAIHREDLLFFAPGDQVFDHITSNAIVCGRGRSCAFELDSAPFNYRGLVLIWNVEPHMYYLYKNHVDPIMMAKFRAYLPMEQIITIYPESEEYDNIKSEMLDSLFRERAMIRDSIHLGRRGYQNKLGMSPIEEFKADYPAPVWKTWLKEAYIVCEKEARRQVQENWDLPAARSEAARILYAQEAVDQFYGQHTSKEQDLKLKYACVLKALENFQLKLDAMVYLRAEKHGSN